MEIASYQFFKIYKILINESYRFGVEDSLQPDHIHFLKIIQ